MPAALAGQGRMWELASSGAANGEGDYPDQGVQEPPPHRPTSELSLEGESVDSGIGKGDSEEVGNVRAFCLVLDL